MNTVKPYRQKATKVYAFFPWAILFPVGLWLMNWFLRNQGLKDFLSQIVSFALLVITVQRADRAGKLILSNQFEGFQELIHLIKKKSPGSNSGGVRISG
jgi:uncharacterized membrane protein YiaA